MPRGLEQFVGPEAELGEDVLVGLALAREGHDRRGEVALDPFQVHLQLRPVPGGGSEQASGRAEDEPEEVQDGVEVRAVVGRVVGAVGREAPTPGCPSLASACGESGLLATVTGMEPLPAGGDCVAPLRP